MSNVTPAVNGHMRIQANDRYRGWAMSTYTCKYSVLLERAHDHEAAGLGYYFQ